MSQNNFLITLKPVTPFFFGGENTFGEGGEANFFVRSNYLPQQTTLLGFLRYELLLQNNLLGTNPKDTNWAALIGPDSFKETGDGFTSDFGAIQSLSPVFLSNGMEHYICQSFDWGMEDITVNDSTVKERLFPVAYAAAGKGNAYCSAAPKTIPSLTINGKNFSQKKGTRSLWVNSSGTVMRQWEHEEGFEKGKGFENGFFIPQQQVGIFRKTKRTKDDTGDFYKKVSYGLNDDFAFSFFAQLDLPAGKKLGFRIVTMGGERSVFEMTITPAAETFETLFTARLFSGGRADTRKAIVLTSDAYAGTEVLSRCSFAITDTVPFRNITTAQQQNGNYIKIRGEALSKRTELLYLLKRGSIFFADDLKDLKKELDNPAFYKIGYNHFIEL